MNRFERWTVTAGGEGAEADVPELLARTWPHLRDAAREVGLSSTWLLHQLEGRHVGLVTVAARPAGAAPEAGTEKAVAGLAASESLGGLLPACVTAIKVFDRTSPILAMWLPESREAGGAPSAHPASPPHPLPTVNRTR
ncbi:hypothetical protein [Streptomyces sp. CBMA152]|uniref:hypothetical protein n=1 Tax=Streptomyces sp. CBMA152 TaxID=1896312 RepID=UPI00166178B3|nr:hypothetical protein [Streptomyces sp. CBMA152]